MKNFKPKSHIFTGIKNYQKRPVSFISPKGVAFAIIFNLSSLILSLLYSLILITLSSLILFTCSSPNSSGDKVTFSPMKNSGQAGTVTLEDTTDFSGVTVSLYEPVELDTALVRINEKYPNIGVQISQETEFDECICTL